jgi:hypothetical protein
MRWYACENNGGSQMREWKLFDKILLCIAIVGVTFIAGGGFVLLDRAVLSDSSQNNKKPTPEKTSVERAFVEQSREEAASLHSSWYMLQSVSLVMQSRDYGAKIGLSDDDVTYFVTTYPEFSVRTYDGNDAIIEYKSYLDKEEARWSNYYDGFCLSFDKYANSLLR